MRKIARLVKKETGSIIRNTKRWIKMKITIFLAKDVSLMDASLFMEKLECFIQSEKDIVEKVEVD